MSIKKVRVAEAIFDKIQSDASSLRKHRKGLYCGSSVAAAWWMRMLNERRSSMQIEVCLPC